MNEKDYLKIAIELAASPNESGTNGPFGAVIVRNNEIIGEGRNSVVRNCDPTAHAEVLAIRDACAKLNTHVLKGSTIYCSCFPCPMCLSAVYWSRIDRVVYAASRHDAAAAGFDDALIYKEFELPEKDRIVALDQLLIENPTLPFEKWAQNISKTTY